MTALSNLAREVREDLAAALQRDPAARSVGRVEMLLTYRGVQALLSHRVSHALYGAGVPLLPRVLSYLTTALTGWRSIRPPGSGAASSSTTAWAS